MHHLICACRATLTSCLATLPFASLLAGCSPDLASFDDTYVPQSVEENFPISVVDRPVNLTVDVTSGGIPPDDVNKVIGFAKQAAERATTPVTVGYASGSKLSRQAADQVAGIIARQGVARQSILVTPHVGQDDSVVMAFGMRVAKTKACGDWSQNMRGDQFNGSGPNFGCTVQQNFAAMVADPEDFDRAKPITPAMSSSQSSALDNYTSGAWTAPVVDPNGTIGQ